MLRLLLTCRHAGVVVEHWVQEVGQVRVQWVRHGSIATEDVISWSREMWAVLQQHDQQLFAMMATDGCDVMQ